MIAYSAPPVAIRRPASGIQALSRMPRRLSPLRRRVAPATGRRRAGPDKPCKAGASRPVEKHVDRLINVIVLQERFVGFRFSIASLSRSAAALGCAERARTVITSAPQMAVVSNCISFSVRKLSQKLWICETHKPSTAGVSTLQTLAQRERTGYLSVRCAERFVRALSSASTIERARRTWSRG